MMPHLGVFASVHPDAAREVFLHDCLVDVAHAAAPVFSQKRTAGTPLAEVSVDGALAGIVTAGGVDCILLDPGASVRVVVRPAAKDVDAGAGAGVALERDITAGLCGVILDGRNRPLRPAASADGQAHERRVVMAALGLMEPWEP